MAKLKIISQSLASRCDVCHQMDKFDPLTGYCLRCSVVMIKDDLSNQDNKSKNTKYSNIIRPKEIELEINNQGLILKYFTFDWDTILGLLLFIAITSVMLYNSWYLTGGILTVICIYTLLATIFNQRIIKLNQTDIDIWEGPLPMGINQKIPTRIIKQVFFKKGFLGDYQLKALLEKGEIIELLPNITTSEIALYFEQQLSRYLGLENNGNVNLDKY